MRWRFIEYRVHLWGQPVSHHRFSAWRTSTLNQLLWQYSCVFLLEINRECSAELSCCNKVCSFKSTSRSKTHSTVTVLTPSVAFHDLLWQKSNMMFDKIAWSSFFRMTSTWVPRPLTSSCKVCSICIICNGWVSQILYSAVYSIRMRDPKLFY